MLRSAIRSLVRKAGFEIVPVGFEASPSRVTLEDAGYHATLCAMGEMSIVVIGANDGVSDDPLYPMTSGPLKHKTRMILFEPQTHIVPFLEKNYAFHPNVHFINEAIGPTGTLTLYSVDPAQWPKLRPEYAKEWPDYAAATGVSSTIRQHVADFLARQGFKDECIVESTVKSGNLKDALDRYSLSGPIDVVQVDCEGFDDEVIYSSNIDEIKPRILYFEHSSLSDSKRQKLKVFMESLGYHVIPMFLNTICIRV